MAGNRCAAAGRSCESRPLAAVWRPPPRGKILGRAKHEESFWMVIVGLTGSIGMGKSTAAKMLRQMGVPVYDADAAVHALQARNGPALPAIEAAFPGVVEDGRARSCRVGRARLRQQAGAAPARSHRPPAGAAAPARLPAAGGLARRRWSCSTFRCCSRAWASAGSTPPWW